MTRLKAAILAYTEYNDRDQRKDERDGASAFVAGSDSSIAMTLLTNGLDTLIAAARQAWNTYFTRFGDMRGEKSSQLRDYVQRLEEGLYTERTNVTEQYEGKLETLEATFGAKSARHDFLRRQENEARTELATVRSRLSPAQRPLRVHFRRTYLVFMVLLSILEAPLNRLSFELFFAETPVLSLLLALAVGVMLMFFAHIVGSVGRTLQTRKWPTSVLINIAVIVFVSSIAYALMHGVALLRQSYVNFTEANEASGGLAAALASGELGQVTSEIFETTLEQTGYILLVVNVAVFLVGILAAFFRHDPDPDYEPAVRRLERAKAKFESLKERANRAQKRIMQDREESMKQLNISIQNAEAERDKVKGEIESCDQMLIADRDTVVAVLDRRLKAFRAGFVREAASSGVRDLADRQFSLGDLTRQISEGRPSDA